MPEPKFEAFGSRGMTGDTPTKPHLALVRDVTGLAIGIPPGALLYLVEDPARPPMPLVVVSVNHKRWMFRCGCGKAGCTRAVSFQGRWSGVHPQREGPVAG